MPGVVLPYSASFRPAKPSSILLTLTSNFVLALLTIAGIGHLRVVYDSKELKGDVMQLRWPTWFVYGWAYAARGFCGLEATF